ncbi:MAG TPA: alpha/beta hydrolase [Kofleriaceae bacterium]|nr:alpha/beta hydrolase [Kofleriaceae bacterium]
MRTLTAILVLATLVLAAPTPTDARTRTTGSKGRYAKVNGVEMYYEIHGKGRPLLLIHGAFCTIDGCFGKLVKLLSRSRQVIAVELQGHGHTADIDRPLSTAAMADDVAALLDELHVAQADVYGYSMGGSVAAQLAIRHPRRVRRVVFAGAALTAKGAQPGTAKMIRSLDPRMMENTPWHREYLKTSPHPEKFRTLVKKIQGLDSLDGFALDDLLKIRVPVRFLLGDADYGTVEHGAEILRLYGGGGFGDTGAPRARSQLAILPGTSHVDLIARADWIAQLVTPFLDAK